MNWNKLQEMQLALDNAILQAKPKMTSEERFNKTLVALSVEVAEIANTVEHFKFWKDNKGKVDRDRFQWHSELMDINLGDKDELIDVTSASPSGEMFSVSVTEEQAQKLTLVEECSDALHFILSLANQNGFEICDVEHQLLINAVLGFPLNRQHSLESDYLSLQKCIQKVDYVESFMCGYNDMVQLVASFIIYYEKLGITTQELEQAYYEKNKVNYERLREGY